MQVGHVELQTCADASGAASKVFVLASAGEASTVASSREVGLASTPTPALMQVFVATWQKPLAQSSLRSQYSGFRSVHAATKRTSQGQPRAMSPCYQPVVMLPSDPKGNAPDRSDGTMIEWHGRCDAGRAALERGQGNRVCLDGAASPLGAARA